MYIGYVQFLLIIFVFIRSLGDNALTEFVFSKPLVAVPLIMFLFVFFSLVLGYLDSRLGFREEEIRNHSKSNPVLMDIQKSLADLNGKVEKIEEQTAGQLHASLSNDDSARSHESSGTER